MLDGSMRIDSEVAAAARAVPDQVQGEHLAPLEREPAPSQRITAKPE